MEHYRGLLETGYFKLARSTSKQSKHKVQIGAVVANKKPITACCNSIKTHPIHANPWEGVRGSVHAETRCVMFTPDDDLKGAIVYVYRERADGQPALARPCNYCYNMLQSKGVKAVYYSIEKAPYWRKEKL